MLTRDNNKRYYRTKVNMLGEVDIKQLSLCTVPIVLYQIIGLHVQNITKNVPALLRFVMVYVNRCWSEEMYWWVHFTFSRNVYTYACTIHYSFNETKNQQYNIQSIHSASNVSAVIYHSVLEPDMGKYPPQTHTFASTAYTVIGWNHLSSLQKKVWQIFNTKNGHTANWANIIFTHVT